MDRVVLSFPHGLPGFEQHRRFCIVDRTDLAPVFCLKSLDSADVRLWVAPVSAVDSGYKLEVSREDLKALGLEEARQPVPDRDVLCLAILCSSQNGPVTANLLAPIIVNLKTRIALQAVRSDRRYSHRHPIGPEAAC